MEIGDVEVVVKEHGILVKSGSVTRRVKGFVGSRLALVEVDGLYLEA